MKLTLLGSGGSLAIPRPFCSCRTCSLARENGIPDARTGPALYEHDTYTLFDTPEEIRLQFERERIRNLKNVFYTHWHPDHTQGMRIFEAIGFTRYGVSIDEPISVYIPDNAMKDFETYCPMLFFFRDRGFITIETIPDRTQVNLGDTEVIPVDFKRDDRIRYGYLIKGGGKRAMYAPCSSYGIRVDGHFSDLDLLFLEMGWFGNTEKVRSGLPMSHPLNDHISFEENIELADLLKPGRTILTHIDGTRHKQSIDHRSLVELLKDYPRLEPAHDGMKFFHK